MSDGRCCAHCGLPLVELRARWRGPRFGGAGGPAEACLAQSADGPHDAHAARPAYCCFGCRFAAAVAAEASGEGQAHATLTRLGLAIFFSMNVMVFTLALWTQDVYGGEPLSSPRAESFFGLLRYLCLLFAAPVLVLLGGPLLHSAVEDLRRRAITTDLLIVLGAAAAYLYSVVAVLIGGEHVYFEVACMVLVAVTLGRWLEASGKQKTLQSLRQLEQLLPSHVRVVAATANPSAASRLPLDQVRVGQCIRVLAGERIAVDGIIVRGQAAVDQRLVTGESLPLLKRGGDAVYAGTSNLDGDLCIEVREPPGAGALGRIIDAVTTAALAKSRFQRAAERVAAWFVPAVSLVAAATFLVQGAAHGPATGLLSGLAVLLIACPCALGIATPMATHAALGQAAARGVLFRSGDALQRLAAVKAICFDKTGTLTAGQPVVDGFVVDEATPRAAVLETALTIASASTHGFSAAIREYGRRARETQRDRLSPGPYPDDLQTLAGRGIVARLNGARVYLGSLRLMQDAGMQRSAHIRKAIVAARHDGLSSACIAWEGRVRGVFVFREQIRDEAQQVLNALQEMGLQLSVLTGDHAARGAAAGQLLGISVQAELLPEDKLAAIREVRARRGPAAMVGDGINDAPALAEADVGIALGCGADVSRDAADVCLLGDDLSQIPWTIELARRTTRIVRENLCWAFAYNTLGIALAATGWLNPIWAAAAMVGSSLFVITNSLRLAAADAPQGLPQRAAPSAERSRPSVPSVSSC